VTDPQLVHRAEQAYLGALLARRGRVGTGTAVAGDAGPGALGGLRPQDFADPVHRAVYAALAGQALPARHGLPAVYERLRGMLTRLLSARARAAVAYMGELPGLCPDPANMAAYAAMVTEASQARAVPASPPAWSPQQRPVAESPQLASAAQWLDSTRTGRRQAGTRQTEPAYVGPPSQAGRTPDGLDRQTARLARALSAGARRRADRVSPPAAASPVGVGDQTGALSTGTLQERVLADLMLHPAGRGDVISWLPATAFAPGNNRTMYQLIRLRLDSGRPVDPLIIAWDASTLADASRPATPLGEPLAAAALRVGALNPAPGTAAILARSLYADQARADSPGPDWRERGSFPVPPHGATSPTVPTRMADPAQAGQDPAAGPRPRPAENPGSQAAPAAAGAGSAPPRHASGLPLRHPPRIGPAEPAPAPRF
jgi:hypothetical protein